MKKWLFLFLTITSLVYLMTTQSGLLSGPVMSSDLNSKILSDKELYSAFEKMTPSQARAPADEMIVESESRENSNEEKDNFPSESQLDNFQEEIKSITSLETIHRIKESIINDIRSHNQPQTNTESEFVQEYELSSVEQLQVLETKLRIVEEEIEDRNLTTNDEVSPSEEDKKDTKYQENYYE